MRPGRHSEQLGPVYAQTLTSTGRLSTVCSAISKPRSRLFRVDLFVIIHHRWHGFHECIARMRYIFVNVSHECKHALWRLPISLPNFFWFASKRPQALFGATVCHHAVLLWYRIPKINANLSFFPLLNCFSMQQEIPEEEAIRAALVQAVSEKHAAQHRQVLKRNVEGVKLEAVHCRKLKALHWMSLRMQCEIAISEAFRGFSRSIFALLVVVQKAPDREQSIPLHPRDTFCRGEDRLQSRCLCVASSVPLSTVRTRLASLL